MTSIIYILGWVLIVEGLFMGIPALTAVAYQESEGFSYFIMMLICLLLGGIITRKRPGRVNFYAKSGLVCTTFGWLLMSLMGCIPFLMTKEIPSFVDAFFETVSGFTTTGASILRNVEALSHTSNMWRCVTHWIGGMGVLVFILAVLPMVSGTNMQLMKAESPGPSVGKLVPKARTTAQLLYAFYIVLTLLEFVLLLCGKMSIFDALCTSFATAGTGGFGIYNNSCGGYSPYVQWVITIFMLLFGVNFNVYYLIFLKRFREAGRCEEMRWYFCLIGGAIVLIMINAYNHAISFEANLRTVAFQIASVTTSTGFSTADFNLWPSFSRGLLMLMMFGGACAGSTGGGTKVSRVVIMIKSMASYIGSFLHPRAVKRVKFEGKEVDSDTIRAICIYYVCFAFIYVISFMLITLENKDLTSSFTAVLATFNNIGPGLNEAGPASNYAGFSSLSKVVMCFDMIAGRLEIFPVLLLFHPRLWHELHLEAVRNRKNRNYTLS